MLYEANVSKTETQSSISDILNDIEWGFKDRPTAASIESIHPYPAKFIGEIPRTLIEVLPIPFGTAVFDPFCGSGTTLVEAQKAGLPSVGIDLNPIACLIARVKTSALPNLFAETVQEVAARARNIKSLPSPDIPNVDHWFKPDIQVAIGAIARTISEPEFESTRNHLRLVLSSIIVRVSNQDSDTRYAAISKNVSREDVFSGFCASASRLLKALMERDWELQPSEIIEGDTLEANSSQVGRDIGLVITSPPYPNAYEYWLYHKYRMWWLGFDPIDVKEKEIGARAHFFKKNHHTADHFVEQMEKTFVLINNVLVRGGFVAFVVGRSKIHGKIIDNGSIIEKVATKIGFTSISRIERVINANRKSFNLSHANIKKESVLVFQKD